MKITFVSNGRDVKVPVGFEDQYKKICSLSGDESVRITIQPNFQRKTEKGNNYFHVLCRRLSEMAGGTMEDIKMMAKSKAVELGYPVQTDESGYPMYDEYGPVGVSASDISISESNLLIEAVHMLAAENGYTLED